LVTNNRMFPTLGLLLLHNNDSYLIAILLMIATSSTLSEGIKRREMWGRARTAQFLWVSAACRL